MYMCAHTHIHAYIGVTHIIATLNAPYCGHDHEQEVDASPVAPKEVIVFNTLRVPVAVTWAVDV